MLSHSAFRWVVFALYGLHAGAFAQTTLTRSSDLAVDVSSQDGELVIALLGGLWRLPARGGAATQLVEISTGAGNPRWSPGGSRLLYTVRSGGGTSVHLVGADGQAGREVLSAPVGARHPDWHPDGERIVYAAPQSGSGLDLFEIDLRSGVRWRLTSDPGDETDPAWSSSGRHLAYVTKHGSVWSLMLRRFGEPDRELFRADNPIAGPAWRPDGTLLSFYLDAPTGARQHMAILSEPPLIRTLVEEEMIARAPIRWRDRTNFVYVADGAVRARGFEDRSSREVGFRVAVEPPAARKPIVIANRKLDSRPGRGERLIVRSGRLFDGLSRGYRSNIDVVIDDGIITELALRRDWGDTPLVDLPGSTLMPGYIDAYAALPEGTPAAAGAHLLSWGITTIVSPAFNDELAAAWSQTETIGPRLFAIRPASDADDNGGNSDTDDRPYLVAASAADGDAVGVDTWRQRGRPVIADGWLASRSLGTNALLGADTVPTVTLSAAAASVVDAATLILISGLGDAGTPGLSALFEARQTSSPARTGGLRRLDALPNLAGRSTAVVVGSQPSGLPPGLAFHAELRALVAAGIDTARVFGSGGANAARLLGLSGQIGEISPGARADLVLIAGDPLTSVAASKDVVGVVRDGRFLSLSNLLERQRQIVE